MFIVLFRLYEYIKNKKKLTKSVIILHEYCTINIKTIFLIIIVVLVLDDTIKYIGFINYYYYSRVNTLSTILCHMTSIPYNVLCRLIIFILIN